MHYCVTSIFKKFFYLNLKKAHIENNWVHLNLKKAHIEYNWVHFFFKRDSKTDLHNFTIALLVVDKQKTSIRFLAAIMADMHQTKGNIFWPCLLHYQISKTLSVNHVLKPCKKHIISTITIQNHNIMYFKRLLMTR